jgi:hypothetical protein
MSNWTETRAQLQQLVKPPAVAREILQAVRAPLRFAELAPAPSLAEVKFAFTHAPLIRHRLTLGDVLLFLNWDQEDLWKRVSAAAV